MRQFTVEQTFSQEVFTVERLNGRIIIKTGDITREAADAIVNAANSTLLGGGGVDGAIHRAGGPEIHQACRRIRASMYPEGLPPGEAALTTGGRLPAKFVIHTVGPVWMGGKYGEEKILGDCYWNSLRLAAENDCRTVAFPSISTGAYRFPRERAAIVSSSTVKEYLERNSMPEKVLFVFFAEDDALIFIENCRF